MRIARRLPMTKDLLDDDAIDDLLLRVHAELQQLVVETRHGERVASILHPILEAVRSTGIRAPIRVLDMGCGLGYVVRWLAAHGSLGDNVELVGCDINETLVEEARRLADVEQLDCEFIHGDAFALAPATVYLSTGLLHHFRGRDLDDFFAAQSRAGVVAACHFGVAPSAAASLASRLYFRKRLRHAVAKHDGIVPTVQGPSDHTVAAAIRQSMAGFAPVLLSTPSGLAALTPFRPVLAVRPGFADAIRAGLRTPTQGFVVP